MSQITEKCSELSGFIFDLKEKLSDQEFKYMLDTCKEIFDLSKTTQNKIHQNPVTSHVCNCYHTLISRCYFYNRCRVKQLVENNNLEIINAIYTSKNLHPTDQPHFYIDEPFENIPINFQYKISIQQNPSTANQTVSDEKFKFIMKNLFKFHETYSTNRFLIFLEIYSVVFKNFHMVKKSESLAKSIFGKLNEMLTYFQNHPFIETQSRCNFNILDILNGWKQHLDSLVFQFQARNQERSSNLEFINEVLARHNHNFENDSPCTYKFRSGHKKGQRCLERGCKSHPSAK